MSTGTVTPAEAGGLVERLRYRVGNPSAWAAYEEAGSELFCEAATALEAKDAELAAVHQRYVDANEARIDAEAALAGVEPVAWLPTATVKWLKEYNGPACGTQTVAHNRPIKTDGGIPVYLAPPTSELEAMRKRVAELEEALEPFAEASRRFDEATERFGVQLTPDHRKPRTDFTHGDLRTARRALTGGQEE